MILIPTLTSAILPHWHKPRHILHAGSDSHEGRVGMWSFLFAGGMEHEITLLTDKGQDVIQIYSSQRIDSIALARSLWTGGIEESFHHNNH